LGHGAVVGRGSAVRMTGGLGAAVGVGSGELGAKNEANCF